MSLPLVIGVHVRRFLVRGSAGIVELWASWSPFWRAQFIGWGLFAIVDLIDRQLIYRNLPAALLLSGLLYPAMLILSGALRGAYGRLFADTRLTLVKCGIVLGLSGVAALTAMGGLTALRLSVGWSIPEWRPLEEFAIPFSYYSLAFISWSILYFWIVSERAEQQEHQRVIEAQAAALRAEIRELQLQLDPHFLFNALNGLAEEVPDNPEVALAMIRDLTQYLRHLLTGIRNPVVSVASEAEGISAYLRLQQARFGARVRSHLDVPAAAADHPIVNMLLQPLVENAFEHGDRSTMLEIDLRVALKGTMLNVEIENTGRLSPGAAPRTDHGLGLQNVQRRLDVHYPGRHSFSLRQAESGAPSRSEGRVVASLMLEGEPCSAS